MSNIQNTLTIDPKYCELTDTCEDTCEGYTVYYFNYPLHLAEPFLKPLSESDSEVYGDSVGAYISVTVYGEILTESTVSVQIARTLKVVDETDGSEGCMEVDWTDISYADVEEAVFQLVHIGRVNERCERVKYLYEHTPFYQSIQDADTVLADLMEAADFDVPEVGLTPILIWQDATDKQSVEEMFYALTDCNFSDFLKQCIEETTRP